MMFIGVVLLVLVEVFDLEFVSGQNDPRTVCRNLLPQIVKIPVPPPGVTVKSPTSWIVAKTTKMKQPYPPDFDGDVNTCRPQTYGPKCAGIQYLRVPDPNGNSYTTHMYADHRTATGNYAHFEDLFQSKDSEYQMYEGLFKSMDYVVDEKQPGTPVETIPSFVQNDHGGKIIAVVDMPADGRWLIFTTCDKQFTMVVLNWQFPVTDSPQTIWARSQTKINERLVKLGIDLTTMVDLPLDSFKFKMYEAIFGRNRPKVGEASTSGAGSTSMREDINTEDTITRSRSTSKVDEPSTSGGGDTSMPDESHSEDTIARLNLEKAVVDDEGPSRTTSEIQIDEPNAGEGSSRKLES